jgi:hypothetical protein
MKMHISYTEGNAEWIGFGMIRIVPDPAHTVGQVKKVTWEGSKDF